MLGNVVMPTTSLVAAHCLYCPKASGERCSGSTSTASPSTLNTNLAVGISRSIRYMAVS